MWCALISRSIIRCRRPGTMCGNWESSSAKLDLLPSETSMNYFEQHHDSYLEGLKTFLRIPSISTLTEHKPDIQRAAEFVREELKRAGLAAELIEGGGNPLVSG